MAAPESPPLDPGLRPTTVDVLAGRLLGTVPAPPLPPAPEPTPLEALENVVRAAVRTPPCVVTFSGGRDSSAVLAVAVRLARREGLPLPVPVTVRFADAPGASEDEWQELVVRHLRLDDWVRLDVDDELDLVGPVSQRILRRYGLLHPAHAALFRLQLDQARGGSFLTGIGGDAVLGGWIYLPLADLVTPGRRGRLDPGLVAYAVAPRPVRRAVRRLRADPLPWLTAEGHRLVVRAAGVDLPPAPLTFGRHLASCLANRGLAAYTATMSLLGGEVGALALDPLSEPAFLAALARAGGRRGFGDRTAVMRAVFADVLPDALLARSDKAQFPFAYVRGPSRAFARSWDGAGLDPALVDVEALRAEWLRLLPNGRTALALQAAWLASAGREGEEPVGDLREEGPVPGAGQLPPR